jgi:two-component system, NarL family, nitrate/nitrite response regulator NarL
VDTVAVCDTEPIAIEGLRSLLQSSEKLRVVAAETSLHDGLDAVRDLKPSLILLDKAFGIQAVMNLLKNLRENGSATSAIIWSASLSGAEALRFLQAGASGIIRKSAPLNSLLTCILTVASGSTWMEEDMLGDMERPIRSGRFPLTARELQVMDLVERGMKNKDIALELGIRTGTVKIHLKHIFEKTGIRGRYGLALSGLKEKGLLSVPLIEAV